MKKLLIIFISIFSAIEVSADTLDSNKEIDLYALSQNIQDVQVPVIEMSVMTLIERKVFLWKVIGEKISYGTVFIQTQQ
tara:strand:+ start:73 stop:309 length:237 start_codon:yes stop_codon:yes gene_type:complete